MRTNTPTPERVTPKPTRRAVMAWTVPAVLAATAAPAYAASAEAACAPTGLKWPGHSDAPAHRKQYAVLPGCTSGEVTAVRVDGYPCHPVDVFWVTPPFTNSRSTRYVEITLVDGRTWSGMVKFPPVWGQA